VSVGVSREVHRRVIGRVGRVASRRVAMRNVQAQRAGATCRRNVQAQRAGATCRRNVQARTRVDRSCARRTELAMRVAAHRVCSEFRLQAVGGSDRAARAGPATVSSRAADDAAATV
jgi:hypothetical protein